MNRNVYQDQYHNAIRISRFDAFEGEVAFSHVAAKFVVSGAETYAIHGKKFLVKKGEYIIGNNHHLSEVYIEQNTLGLCVDISSRIISEIIDHNFENHDLKEFILSDKFLINQYNARHTLLGHTLNRLSQYFLDEQKDNLLTQELFYSIGENIVTDQSIVFEQFSKLNYKKPEVQEAVFRNLLQAKYFIDEGFLHPIQLDDLAQVAFISKYAFVRHFKTTFGITPYQYILQKRLLFAQNLLLQGEKVVNVASAAGFADAPSFSKAFKNHFRMSPATFCK